MGATTASITSWPRRCARLNRCSGQTWILVRTYRPAAKGNPGQYVYQWSALASEGPEARLREPTQAPAAGGDKCFVFQGRRFCE